VADLAVDLAVEWKRRKIGGAFGHAEISRA
jgi:hypothetical protein